MKNKLRIALMLLLLVSMVAGCGDTNTEGDATIDTAQDETVNDMSEDNINAEDSVSEEESGYPSDLPPETDLTSLTEEELLAYMLASAMGEPDKLYLEAISNDDMYSITTITYYLQGNVRTETYMEEMTYYSLYLAQEEATYQYDSESTEGVIIPDGEFYDDSESDSFSLEDISDSITNVSLSENMGMTALHFTTTTDIDGSVYRTEYWMSTEYWIPLCMEQYFNDELTYTYQVTAVESRYEVTDDLFVPPSDIVFTDINAMMDLDFLNDDLLSSGDYTE